MKIFTLLILCLISLPLQVSAASLYVNRAERTLHVLNDDGSIAWSAPCGIGKGGLKKKVSMSDQVTPTGKFTVDVVLYDNEKFNKIAKADSEKYGKDKIYKDYVSSKSGLEKLFKNMNELDFNNDERPDRAYGIAYIGLVSEEAMTGPKLEKFKGIPYWFSIAIHGTSDAANIGKANSGGCIHLGEEYLRRLVEEGLVDIGTNVVISD